MEQILTINRRTVRNTDSQINIVVSEHLLQLQYVLHVIMIVFLQYVSLQPSAANIRNKIFHFALLVVQLGLYGPEEIPI